MASTVPAGPARRGSLSFLHDSLTASYSRAEPFGRAASPGRRSSSISGAWLSTRASHDSLGSPRSRRDGGTLSGRCSDPKIQGRGAANVAAVPILLTGQATSSRSQPRPPVSGREWRSCAESLIRDPSAERFQEHCCDNARRTASEPQAQLHSSQRRPQVAAGIEDHRGSVERFASLEELVHTMVDRQTQGQVDTEHKLQEVSSFHGRVLAEHVSLGRYQASLEQRVAQLERLLADVAEERKQHVNGVRMQLQDLYDTLAKEKNVWGEQFAATEQRLGQLEGLCTEAHEAQRKAADFIDLQQRCATIEKSFVALEDNMVKVAKTLEVQRMAMEADLGSIRETASKHANDCDVSLQRMHALEGNLEAWLHWRQAAEEQIGRLEAFAADPPGACGCKQDVWTLQQQLQQELYAAVRTEAERHDSWCAKLEHRVVLVEGMLFDSAGKHARELEVAASVAHEQKELAARVSAMSDGLRLSRSVGK